MKKEKLLVDIFIFGSALKGKTKPNDIDLAALFREKDYEKIEDILYRIQGSERKLNLHVEPLFVDNLHKEKLYTSIFHEGFSVKNGKFLSEMLGFKSYLILNYSLKDKKKSGKVRFSYALYGRRKELGLLKRLKGKEIGRGSVMVPIKNSDEIIKFLEQWDVKYQEQRALLFD